MDTSINTPQSGETRRSFIKKSATAAAAVAGANLLKTPVYGQATAPSANVTGANNKIVVGFIGVGGQGFNAHVRNMKASMAENNLGLAAVCDVSKTRVNQAKGHVGGDCQGFNDYRKLLERKDIDAIVCSTVDHWHTKISVDAMNSGKHVYVEKPMTRYLGEAFEIYDTCKKTGKILTVGSQGSSDPKWHLAADWIRAGKIGPIVMAQGSYMRNNPNGEWNYKIQDWCTPEDLDWKTWMGPVKTGKTFSADHYFRWRKYYPYCGGLLGDLLPHKLHPYMIATGNPEFPTRVASLGSKKWQTDKNYNAKNDPDTYMRDVPEIVQIIAEFPSGMVMHLTSSTVNEQGTQEMIRGQKASLTMAGNRVELKPERPFAEEIDPETSAPMRAESVPFHHKNWFESIRENKQPNAGIDLAVKVQTVISLAEMSERMNIMCVFDEKTRKITTGDGRPVTAITYGSLDA